MVVTDQMTGNQLKHKQTSVTIVFIYKFLFSLCSYSVDPEARSAVTASPAPSVRPASLEPEDSGAQLETQVSRVKLDLKDSWVPL